MFSSLDIMYYLRERFHNESGITECFYLSGEPSCLIHEHFLDGIIDTTTWSSGLYSVIAVTTRSLLITDSPSHWKCIIRVHGKIPTASYPRCDDFFRFRDTRVCTLRYGNNFSSNYTRNTAKWLIKWPFNKISRHILVRSKFDNQGYTQVLFQKFLL